ncbi:MAG: alpha/beta hydrolase [Candidatus Saccharibacteria bacterium]|nr:alpha/beta hydrolase [Candidatus Saccharibacteria bacterium]
MPQKKANPHLSTLYIIHGWTYRADYWQKTLDLLREHKIKVQFLYVPGLTKPSQRVWTIQNYVAWLRKELRGDMNPVVLGHSNGGRIALNYCYQYPNHLKHLILLNSAGIQPKISRRLRNFIILILAKIFKPLKNIPLCQKLAHRLIWSSDYAQAPKNMKKTLHHLLTSDRVLAKRLADIKTPISLIWGQTDRVTPIWMMKVFKQKLPEIRTTKILKDIGHAPYIHQPQILVASLLKVLSKI